MPNYRIAKITAAVAAGAVMLTAATVAAVPMTRNIVSGWWNNPEGLPALPENPLVHYEGGGSEYARTVAGLLPAAVAHVQAVHGRPFAHPVTIGTYVTPEAFVAANGLGDPHSVGMTFLGRVMLSPGLFSRQRRRLPALLTHELSHAHIESWISDLGNVRLPQWFKEGLAVMVSGGGGAESVSEMQARNAILRGDHIAVESSGSLFNIGVVRFVLPPELPDPASSRKVMAYRQAGMFVSFLHDSDPAGFARMMNAILDGRSLAEAVTAGYKTDLQTLWSRFVQAAAAR